MNLTSEIKQTKKGIAAMEKSAEYHEMLRYEELGDPSNEAVQILQMEEKQRKAQKFFKAKIADDDAY